MIKITKFEKDYLVSKGYKFHEDLNRTYTKHPTYYAVENPRLLKELNKYRNARKVV